MSKEMREQIDRVKNFKQFVNEQVENRRNDIKLGDKIVRGKINSNGFTVGNPKHIKDYRVVGLNPKVKLQQVITKKGEQELGDIIEIDNNIVNSLRPMFPDNHFINSIDDSDWSHIWVGDF